MELLPALSATGPTPVIILSAAEVGPEVAQHVAATMVKSRVAHEDIRETILKLIGSH